jgi:hypothetical protein
MHRLALSGLLCPVLLALLLAPTTARGHDGSLYGVQPFSEGGEFAGGATTYGLILAEDGSNLWTCVETIGATPFWWHRVSGERIVVGTNQGIRISEDGGCSWSVPAGLAGELTSFSVAARPGVPQELIATTGAAEAANHVLRSEDGGLTWASVFEVEEAGIWRAVWDATGTELIAEVVHGDGRTVLYRSQDGGSSWSATLLDLGDWRSVGLFGPSLDGQSLWLTALSPEGEFVLGRVAWTLDSALEVLRAFPNLITAFVEEEDSLHLVIYFSDYMTWTGLAQDEPILSEVGIGPCLYGLDGLLWGCGGEPMNAQFSRRSAAGDWQEVIRIADIEPRSCPEATLGADVCPAEWLLVQEALNPTVPPGDDDDSSDCSGCDSAGSPSLALLLLVLPIRFRRQRVSA